MSIGFKIKKLREQKNISQPELATILNISQAKLSNIENEQTQKIDFLLMHKICTYFGKDVEYFIETTNQINKIKKIEGSVNNYGTVNFFPETLLDQVKALIEENEKLKLLLKKNKNE